MVFITFLRSTHYCHNNERQFDGSKTGVQLVNLKEPKICSAVALKISYLDDSALVEICFAIIYKTD
jgi:hypothetical protein